MLAIDIQLFKKPTGNDSNNNVILHNLNKILH
jgi:hypothetical protein